MSIVNWIAFLFFLGGAVGGWIVIFLLLKSFFGGSNEQ